MSTITDNSQTIVYSRPLLAERFEIIETIGSGAAGTVFRALDRAHNKREVALKVLVNKSAFDDNTMQRFLNELEVCQGLRHPNLIEAYDLVRLPDGIAYTMEFVKGSDLATLIRERTFNEADLDPIFIQILSALQVLHQVNIVHRDLKLENVLLTKDGHAKVVDLGLMKQVQVDRKLTQTGILLGTAQYMPPEYVRHGRYDQRSDLYSVGLMLYELLKGERRYIGIPGAEILRNMMNNKFKIEPLTQTRSGEISERYRKILERSLNPKPEKRYQSAEEMRLAFEQPLLIQPIPNQQTVSLVSPARKRKVTGNVHVFGFERRRNRVKKLIKFLGVTLVLLILGAFFR